MSNGSRIARKAAEQRALEGTPERAEPPMHDHDSPEGCSHCAPMLRKLDELARLMRLQINHEGTVDKSGFCKSQSCWCAT